MVNLVSVSSIIGQAVTVALIVVATRWVVGAKGAQLPRIRAGTSVYGIKWQYRAVGLAGGLFSAVIALKVPYDLATVASWVSLIALSAVMLLGLWMAIGRSVTTDQGGVTKKDLWHTNSVRWDDISEIRLHKEEGGAIELRAGHQKIIIDARFVARQHLLGEIVAHTRLRPIGPSLEL